MTSRDAIVDVGLSQHVGFARARAFRELLLVPTPLGETGTALLSVAEKSESDSDSSIIPTVYPPLRSEMHSNCD